MINGWIVILCATALSVGAGWLVRETKDPVYSATTRVFVTTPGGAQQPDVYYGSVNAMMRAVTYQQLARSTQVTTRTIDQLGLSKTPEDLAKDILVGAKSSAVMEIRVTGTSADVTRDTANAVTANMIQLSTEIKDLDTSNTDIVPVDAATSAREERGSLTRYLLLGGAFGFVISAALVIAYGLACDRVLNRNQLDHIADESIAGRDK
jgi:capsular polysaccharide biosynthesis protein